MVENIKILMLGEANAVSTALFLSANKNIFTANSILPVTLPALPDDLTLKNIESQIYDSDKLPQAKILLADLLNNSDAGELIFDLSFYPRLPARLYAWIGLIRHFFPTVKTDFIFCLAPPDMELESAFAYALSKGIVLSWRRFVWENIGRRITLNFHLNRLKNIEGINLNTVAPDSLQTSQALASLIYSGKPLNLTPAPFVRYNYNSILFMEFINSLYGSHSQKYAPDWSSDQDFLFAGDDYQPLASQALRKTIIREYSLGDDYYTRQEDPDSYYKAANDLRNNIFWHEAEEINWSWACNQAKRLAPDLAKKILASAPEERKTLNEQALLCLDALDATHGGKIFPVYKKTLPEITVLTACYNHEKFIGQCIEGVLSQETSFPVKHIVSDDGSTDGSPDIIMEYASKHASIKPILQKKNAGGAVNYELLYKNAHSPYVSMCDGDDWFLDPHKLQIQHDFMTKNRDAALCFHPVNVVFEGKPEKSGVYPPVDEMPRGIKPFYYLADLVKHNFIQTNSVLYRWRFPKFLPDWVRTDLCPLDWYFHLLHAETGKIGFINRIMSAYRIHKGGVYSQAHEDMPAQRAKLGYKELQAYETYDLHFKGRFHKYFVSLANGIFVDCLRFDQRQENNNNYAKTKQLLKRFPQFGNDFLNSIEFVKVPGKAK